MKHFKFLLIFGMLAGIVFVSVHADKTAVSSVVITDAAKNEGYMELTGKLNSYYRLYKGYRYESAGENVVVTVYSSIGLIGARNFVISVPAGSDATKYYITDGKESKLVFPPESK